MPLLGSRGAASLTGFGGLAKLGYLLRNSLRFRGANNAYLSRTPSVTGNRKVWTWSGWVKRGQLDSGATDRVLFSSPSQSGNDGIAAIYFNADKLHTYYDTSGANPYGPVGPALYRDPAAWYHIVWAVDAANTIHYVYVNNTLVSTDPSYYPPNYEYSMNRSGGYTHTMGTQAWGATNYFDGYMTEINFVDGQALTPSSFGKTDPATGQWIPKQYSGTYGTNGFYLKFTDASAATAAAIGKDSSGNGNNWTPNNISVTAGVTYDSMTDVPTLTSATAANYCVLNPLEKNGGSVVDGNLNFTNGSATSYMVGSTIVPTGLCYAEFQPTGWGNGNNIVGLRTNLGASNSLISASGGVAYDLRYGTVVFNGTTQATYTTATGTSNVVMLAYDPSSGKLWFGLDGTWFNSGNPAAGTGQVYTITTPTDAWRIFVQSWDGTNAMSANFGQRPFAYTPPSGFKALNTYNLP